MGLGRSRPERQAAAGVQGDPRLRRAGQARPGRRALTAARRGLVGCIAAGIVLAGAGCGDAAGTKAGGRVVGETLTVRSLIPVSGSRAAAGRDVVDGQKLALADSGGTIGAHKINFASLDIGDRSKVAARVRETLADTQMIAAIADLDSETARITVPLLNAGGILHVSPGATYAGFVAALPDGPEGEPGRWRPSGRISFAPMPPTDPAQAVAIARAARGPVAVESEAGDVNAALAAAVRSRLGDRLVANASTARTVVYVGDDARNAEGVVEALAREARRARILLPEALLRTDLASRLSRRVRRRVRFLASAAPPRDIAPEFRRRFGRCPGPYAGVGYEAMRRVLDAVERAGRRSSKRSAVIAAYFEANPLDEAASAPWYVATGPSCDDRFRPVA